MAVAFDNKANVIGFTVQTVNVNIAITSNANRAAAMHFAASNNAFTYSDANFKVGGVAGVTVPGTDSGTANATMRSLIVAVTAPPSGTQNAIATWTSNITADLGIITASGVDQTTPMNNGTFNTAAALPISLAVTSNNGDLTTTAFGAQQTGTTPSTNQTVEYTQSGAYAGDIGPGTAGPITHTWNAQTGNCAVSGANFVQAAAAALPAVGRMPSLRMVR